MTPAKTQRLISYVINYAQVAKNHIHENSIDARSITNTLNDIQSCALLVIDRINKGDIIAFSNLVEACSPIGDALFEQLTNDMDYSYYANELAEQQREGYELAY
jgi:hypothetical protein